MRWWEWPLTLGTLFACRWREKEEEKEKEKGEEQLHCNLNCSQCTVDARALGTETAGEFGELRIGGRGLAQVLYCSKLGGSLVLADDDRARLS